MKAKTVRRNRNGKGRTENRKRKKEGDKETKKRIEERKGKLNVQEAQEE